MRGSWEGCKEGEADSSCTALNGRTLPTHTLPPSNTISSPPLSCCFAFTLTPRRFSEAHRFAKPNDAAALELMNRAALHVCEELRGQVTLAFGESDEYSFLFRRDCRLYNRRGSKILTYVVSLFTSAYVFWWKEYMRDTPLRHPPTFDGRIVLYPTATNVKDYFAWRQADTHINNLYNTTFWALIQQGGQSEREAHATLKGTVSGQKHEILHQNYGINYAHLPAMFRRGTTIVRAPKRLDEWREYSKQPSDVPAVPAATKGKGKGKADADADGDYQFYTLHVDVIGEEFWSSPVEMKAKAARKEAERQARRQQGGGNGSAKAQEGEGEDGERAATATQTQTQTEKPAPPSSSPSPPPISAPTPIPTWLSPDRLDGVGMGRWVL